jgi:hypothetical protein
MAEFEDAFDAAFPDYNVPGLPASGAAKPVKALVRQIGGELDEKFAEVEALQEAGVVGAETWSVLSGYSTEDRVAGDTAEVTGPDAGTHTDPVVGGSPVANEGRYRWSASPAGWKRIGDTTTKVIADAVAAIETAMEDAEDLAAAKNQLAALIFQVDYAFKDAAEYSAMGGATSYPPEAGKRMVWYDRDPEVEGPSLYLEGNGTSWVDGAILPYGRAIEEYESSTIWAPYFKHWKAHWNSGTPGDGLYGLWRGSVITDGAGNYNDGSTLIDLDIDGDRKFIVGPGYIQVGQSDTELATFAFNGSAGVVIGCLPSGSGTPATLAGITWGSTDHVGDTESNIEVYWGAGSGGRVHHVVQGAHVVSALGGRFEWEGYGGRLSFVGYESASAIGKPFDFNDSGQSPTSANPIVSFSTVNTSTPDTVKLVSFNTLSGGIYTETGYVTGSGRGVFSKVGITGDTLNIGTQKTPASASATGTKGDICHDANFLYVCVAANTWRRVALSTW